MSLNGSLTKTSQQVSTPYNLTCSLTVGQILNANSNNNNSIEIVLPASNYNLSTVVCIQGGTNLNCSKSYDSLNQLHISFIPPCSPCAVGTILTFAVTNLVNPSFINTAN